MKPMKNITALLNNYLRDTSGIAATEAALILPVMLIMLFGTYDVGLAILTNNKIINASQIGANLVARNKEVDSTKLNNVIDGAKLAIQPYDTSSFGIDIVSLRFDDDGQPEIMWRETRNMSPNDSAVQSTRDLNIKQGEGMVIVTVNYQYEPMFAGKILSTLNMQEVAFSRGRRTPVVCPCPRG